MLSEYPNIKAVIWTTTPWTIPANLAISVGADIEYCVVEDTEMEGKDNYYLIAKDRVGIVQELIGRPLKVKRTVSGKHNAL